MKKGEYIGIDFGTTNTSVVFIQHDENGTQETLFSENNKDPFSSIVAIPKDGDELLFGRKVREQRLTLAETHEVYTSMKSFLGQRDSNGEPINFVVGGKRYYPKDITAAYLRYIKEYVKEHHGIDIDAASFAFPVDFSPEARRELYWAANQAGIEVKAFLSESTAAYISNREKGKTFSKVMVLDWGGGTFDISILKLTGNSIHELSVWGDHIGGDNIDYELAERVHSKISSTLFIGRFEDMPTADKDNMITLCEKAKISISDDRDDSSITVRNYGGIERKTVPITEDWFNSIVEGLIKQRVLEAIDNALNKAGGITPASIDAVIVVGGSSGLHSFENIVMNLFKNADIIVPEEKQWSTAVGAALMQIVGGNFRLSDGVGVKLSDDTIFTVLKKGQAINVPSDTATFSLTEESKSAHFIFTDETGKVIYLKKNVPTKGFLEESFELDAIIGDDQIAKITISNSNFGRGVNAETIVELNKLTFNYDISALNESGRIGAYHGVQV